MSNLSKLIINFLKDSNFTELSSNNLEWNFKYTKKTWFEFDSNSSFVFLNPVELNLIVTQLDYTLMLAKFYIELDA